MRCTSISLPVTVPARAGDGLVNGMEVRKCVAKQWTDVVH